MSLHHHSLFAWQRTDDLFITLHQLALKAFPLYERFELGGQLRRAAYSVAANVVEGFARPAGRARLNFLHISQSSLAEVGYCIHVAQRLGYLSEAQAAELEVAIKQVGAPLAGLIRATRLRIGSQIAGIVVLIAYLTVRLG
jgi:four helix bundle protein